MTINSLEPFVLSLFLPQLGGPAGDLFCDQVLADPYSLAMVQANEHWGQYVHNAAAA